MENDKRSLMQRLIDAGYPQEDIWHHYSDLYVYVTPLTTEVIDHYYKENGLSKEVCVSTFRDQITGKPMYDVAFMYTGKQ